MSYRDQILLIADATARKVVAIFDRYSDGELDHDTTVALIAAVIAKANHRAATVADLSLAATLMLQLRKPIAVAGVQPPPEDPERLTRSVTTLLAVTGLTVERVVRLARSEPLAAAANAYADAIARSPVVVGWTRQTNPGACPVCRDLAGPVLPKYVPMWHHPGCTCTPVPTTEEETHQ